MGTLDLVLLHPPSVVDFRRKMLLPGPVSDLIPSTPVFEMYPIGYTTIASHLETQGYEVRIVNIATRMLASERFDPDRFIRSLDSEVYGIDLHWMPHVQGSLELAKMVKRHHPDAPVVFGGFSASYYHEELIRDHPEVDFVLRGDSAEKPLEMLLGAVEKGGNLAQVPNLAWRDNGHLRSNPITHVPEHLDDIVIDYGLMVRKVLRFRDLDGHLPYKNWKSNPMSIAVGVRGCLHNCLNCAGSCDSFRRNFGREKPAFRSPELLAEDISRAEEHVKGAIFLVGDPRMAGNGHSSRFLSELKKRRTDNEIVIELFTPADRGFAKEVSSSVDRFSIQMSPETHDVEVRQAQGKHYPNEALEKSVEVFLEAGCRRFDLFYMIGLPKQTPESVDQTVEYCRRLYDRFKGKRLFPFISPLAPFLDPGGNAFEEPRRHGYRLFASTLEDHLHLATKPSWKYVLNYETEWMSRGAIVEKSYAAGIGLNAAKRDAGLISPEVAQRTETRIKAAQEMVRRIDSIVLRGESSSKDFDSLRESAAKLNESTLCEKAELDWSENSMYASIPRMVRSLLRGR